MSKMRKPMEEYKGRHIGCAPGTHAALHDMILKHVAPRDGVLDFGAHSGALLLRMQDSGFTGMVGTDLDSTRFDLPGADFLPADLNLNFAENFDRKFGLLTATDVIEHLDSPRHFLSQARQLLDDDGWIALSFPNIAFWEGRAKFVLKGELWGFGARNYIDQRHISPMTVEQTLLMLREVGFEPKAWGSGGSFATPLRKIVTFPGWAAMRLLGGPMALGESSLFLAQKAQPQKELKMPVHYRDRWRGVPDGIGLS